MNFSQIVKYRQSCRSYDPSKEIEEEKLATILDSARFSPSACKGQPYHIYRRSNSQGLGSCILGWFDSKKLTKLCNLKGEPRLVIALGYAKADDKLRTKKRKDMQELVTIKE